jgi:chitodextrinase
MLRPFLLLVSLLAVAACGGGGENPTNWANSTSQTDTTPPSRPTGLTGVPMGSTGASLSWSASTDNMGVTAYVVRRNGTQVATPATTTYVDSGLSAATTYSYTVAAHDAAGNVSPLSASVSVTTATVADTVPPSPPTGFAAVAAGSTSANLSWNASTDNVAVTAYILRRNGAQIATPTTTTYSDTGLSAATTYTYTVAARDAAGNTSSAASASVTTTAVADMTPPSQPAGFAAVAAGSTSANLSWNASTDNVAVTAYILKRNGVQIATPTATTYSDTGLSAATTYTYTVAARDAAGNTSSAASASVTTAPTPPSNSAGLAWDAVVAPNISGYRVYFGLAPRTYLQSRGQGISVGDVTTYTVIGLSSATRYYFAVTAADTLGNESDYSNEVLKDIP